MSVEEALADLFGLRPEAVSWRRLGGGVSGGISPLLVIVGDRLRLELRDASWEPPAWVRGRFAGLSWRSTEGDPLADPDLVELALTVAVRFKRRETEERLERISVALAEAGTDTPLVGGDRLTVLQDHFGREGHDLYRHPEGAREFRLATLRLGFVCNQKCGFCWQGRTWPDAPEGRWQADLEELASEGVRRVTITGGEPTVYRHLEDVISRATGLEMVVHLQTNAIRLARQSYTEGLVAAGLRSCFVSLHAADAETSDAMTRAPGTWARTCDGVTAALAAGLDVRINCVVERANVDRLAEHAAMVVERFAGVSGVSYSHPTSYYDEELYADALVPLDAVREPLTQACRVLCDAGIPVDVLGTCGFPPCLLDDPALRRELRAEEFSRIDTDGRTWPEACDPCSLRSTCLGLRKEYLDVWGARGLTPR